MSTRSANNPRTQNREYTGATRKSASSAKPARAAASSVRVVPASNKARRKQEERGESLEGLSKEEKRARKRELRAQEDRRYAVADEMLKSDQDYPQRRRVFWALVVAGVIIIAAAWLLLSNVGGIAGAMDARTLNLVEIVIIVLGYVAIIGAMIYDFVRIRPLRNYYRSKAEGMTDARARDFLASTSTGKNAKKGFKKNAGHTVEPVKDGAISTKKKPKKNQRSRR